MLKTVVLINILCKHDTFWYKNVHDTKQTFINDFAVFDQFKNVFLNKGINVLKKIIIILL